MLDRVDLKLVMPSAAQRRWSRAASAEICAAKPFRRFSK
ncbi:MAG: hypothetical protein CM1200mP34_4320 [Verrucomicrobiales bacterium]|nr:MAG: hypothetical protein CM1200mP34_4320 [Verrucomicrobiales bacterium]